MKLNYKIGIAEGKDLQNINSLLSVSKLCPVDSKYLLENFLLVTIEEKIIGVIGLELFGDDALLRSFAVEEDFRQKGIGTRLYNEIMEMAAAKSIKQIYLLTETAQTYFELRGFEIVDRNSAPPKILDSTEFQTFCPESAVCMRKKV